MRDPNPIKKLHNCRYCSEQPDLIPPDDKFAQKQEDGSWKCGNCVHEDFQKRTIRVLGKDHPENQALIAEEQRKVDAHNKEARRLNEAFVHEALKPKKDLTHDERMRETGLDNYNTTSIQPKDRNQG